MMIILNEFGNFMKAFISLENSLSLMATNGTADVNKNLKFLDCLLYQATKPIQRHQVSKRGGGSQVQRRKQR